MQYAIEHLATAVSAISGSLAARGKQVDLFGVVVLAQVTALGGGTLRDTLLDAHPIFWIRDPAFVVTATLASLATFVVARFRALPTKWLLFADAGGLALFTLVGVEKALQQQAPILVAGMMGILTGVAGGMIRDVLTGEIPLVFRRQIYLYATASLVGATLFLTLRDRLAMEIVRPLAISATLALRLAAIQWRLGLPDFHSK